MVSRCKDFDIQYKDLKNAWNKSSISNYSYLKNKFIFIWYIVNLFKVRLFRNLWNMSMLCKSHFTGINYK